MTSCSVRACRSTRGQLVIVAAAAIALALFPMVLAYLQLGYAGDVAAEPTGTTPSADTERALDRAVHKSAAAVDGSYEWNERTTTVAGFKEGLSDDVSTLETARLEEGVAVAIEYRPAVAQDVSSQACPGGENRAFGPCEAFDGVVVQERAGETVVVAAAFRIHVTRTDGVTELTVVIEVSG